MSAAVEKILRQHPRERLFVQPLEWTSRHLELLGITFQEDVTEVDELEHRFQQLSVYGSPDPETLAKLTDAAEGLGISEIKNHFMRKLFTEAGGFFEVHRAYGFFQYGLRQKCKFRLHGTVLHPIDRTSKLPDMAFMQRQMMLVQRGSLYPMPQVRRRRHGRNLPVRRDRDMRLKLLQPEVAHLDPYIVTVLIGLAQTRAEIDAGPGGRGLTPQSIYATSAIFIQAENNDSLYLYKAKITSAFLGKFAFPAGIPESPEAVAAAGLVVLYKAIPFKPYETLRDRVLVELL